MLNCLNCDDVLRLVEAERKCECGKSSGSCSARGAIATSGPVRVLQIPWEHYDRARPGEDQSWFVLSLGRTDS